MDAKQREASATMILPPQAIDNEKGIAISSFPTPVVETTTESNSHHIIGAEPLSRTSALSESLSTLPLPLLSTVVPTNSIDNMVHSEPESPTQPRQSHDHESDETALTLKWKLGTVTTSNEESVAISRKSEDISHEELLQAIEILNKLAGMDSTDFHASLKNKNLPWDSTPQVQTVLSGNPQIFRLHQSIYRFHSLVRNLSSENDQQTLELLELHQTLEANKNRMAQLEAAVTKLYKRNTKLKAYTKSNQGRTRKLFQQVQEFMTNATKRKQQDDFDKLAMQIQHHEQIINRERTDSNFSELDGLQDFLQETSSVASDIDTTSPHSSVFDDGVATLRISREITSTWPHLEYIESDHPLVDSAGSAETHNSNEKLERDDSQRLPQSKFHNPNPFTMLLGPRSAQPYTLQFLEPFQLQFVDLLEPSGKDSMTNVLEIQDSTIAFAVCGYHGFDCDLNVKPTVGARLLQINKQNVDPLWTVQDLEQHIRGLGPRTIMTFRNDSWSKTQKETLQLAIQEQERLNPEAQLFVQPTFVNPFTRKRSQSGDNVTPTNNNLADGNSEELKARFGKDAQEEAHGVTQMVEQQQDAGQKFKASMQQMGKIFNFR